MAPIQKHISSLIGENSHSATSKTFTASTCSNKTRTSSSSNSITSNDGGIASNNRDSSRNHITHFDEEGEREIALPIISRGHFYQDSFFKDLREQFDNAVRDTLDLWDSRSPFEEDLLRYRRMRDLNLTEETQALSVSQDDNSHQVVIDVRDFMDGDIKVKVVDDSELVIEGSVEKRQDGSVSKKTFCRRFSFPALLSEDTVSSSMSADGVLTVTLPKKISLLNNKEGKTVNITASHKKSANNTNTHMNTSNNVEKKRVNFEEKTSKSSQVKVQEDQSASTESKNTQDSSDSTKDNPLTSFHVLPISERGPFFRDSFFQDTRRHFQEAIDQILNEWGQVDSASDHMNTYRNLRKHHLQEKNQAVAFAEDHQCYKVVVDVQDFKEGDVKVKVVDENELTIEGNLEIKRDESVSSKSFFRRFSFPGLVSADTVTSVMSSDGILTVTVPKATSGSKIGAVSEAAQSQVSQSSSKSTEENQSFKTESKSERQSFHSMCQNACEATSTSSLMNNILSEEKHRDKDAHDKICESGAVLSHNAQSSKNTMADHWLPISLKGQFFSDSFSKMSVVLDVHDFPSEDVKVKVVDNKEVVVEGVVEKNDGTFRSSKSFCRRFNFPGEVDMNAVTSAMSSDGVLTITAPKV
ncbi:uncharacterized protein LOC122248548 [Penaeus japonicus]|uniref:uncharacterized protein LOC122248548 n=1 Tax=Penaeus japonicus TaxID=27405 RepID=UPI001C714DA3|nr:uncharacterized protein LOC122248548 [Penaeus japonicus]